MNTNFFCTIKPFPCLIPPRKCFLKILAHLMVFFSLPTQCLTLPHEFSQYPRAIFTLYSPLLLMSIYYFRLQHTLITSSFPLAAFLHLLQAKPAASWESQFFPHDGNASLSSDLPTIIFSFIFTFTVQKNSFTLNSTSASTFCLLPFCRNF